MEKKINLEEIIKTEWAKYPDNYIDINSTAGILLLQKIITDCMKEACKQTLELAAENAELTTTHTSPGVSTKFKAFWIPEDDYDSKYWVIIDSESILNTINQIE